MAVSSIIDLLLQKAEECPDKRSYTFLTGGEEAASLTFFELAQRAQAIAARLQQLNAEGHRALLLFPPGIEYISAFYGCLAARTVAIPAYPPRMNRNLERLEAILEDASPKVVLTTEGVFRQMQSRFGQSPHLAKLDWILSDEVPLTEADAWVNPQANGNSVAFLQYTSASTSKPKGVIVNHGNILHNQILMKEAVHHTSDTVAVSWLPMFHDMGLISVILASLYNGMSCYLMSPVDFLKKPRLWLEVITKYRATFSGAPDFGFNLCVDKITPDLRQGLDLSTWNVAYNGSEPVRAETLRRFTRAFSSVGFRPEGLFSCYGLAEHTLFTTGSFYKGSVGFSRESLEAHRPSKAADSKSVQLVSCGSPLFDTTVRIVDTHSGQRCPDGQIGEIWLASPSVAQGYWNKPEESKRDFGARLANEDGSFLRTGDLGFIHDGEIFVTGRIKDLIIIRGRNLVPQDIEQTVEQCDPAIQPAFAAAVSLEAAGAERLVVVAEVRREVRRKIDAKDLIDRIGRAVAAEYAVEVSAVVLLRPGTLPKTSSGKTQRAKVARDFLNGSLNVLEQWRDDAVFGKPQKEAPRPRVWRLASVEDWLAERLASHVRLSGRGIDRNLPISSFGIDSLSAAVFISEIEETFGVELGFEVLFAGEPTVCQLAQRLLADAKATRSAKLEGDSTNSPDSLPRFTEPNGSREHKENLIGQLEEWKASLQPIGGGEMMRRPVTPSAEVQPNGRVRGPVSRGFSGQPDEFVRSNGGRSDDSSMSQRGRANSPQQPPPTVPGNGTEPPRHPPFLGQHPFRTSVNPELGRLLAQMGMDKTFVRGEGSWLWDEKGKRYLDFLAQYGALPFGFNPPRIWAALNTVRDIGEPSFVQPSFLNAAGELARRLLAVAPLGMAYATFTNSGAEAVEAAIKLCRSTTGRHDILAASNGFHGKTLGALSATDKEKYQKPFGAPVAGFDYVKYGDVQALRRALSTGRYAGFVLEPLQAEGGIVEPPLGYLRSARKLCREAGTLFVADEIQTGLGRTGAMFVCSELGITPDVMTVAKALGGGLIPIGAVLSTAAAYNEDFALKHTSTFAGNTLACRAGIATLDLLEENGGAMLKRVTENGARLKDGLIDLKRRFPGVIAEVRGRGYLLGVRFGLDRYSVEDGMLGYLGEHEAFTFIVVSHLLNFEGVRVGCTLNQGGVLRIEPPLNATWDQCMFFLQALERVVLLLQRRDVAALTAQVTGLQLPVATEVDDDRPHVAVPQKRRQSESNDLRPRPGDGRFAFLVHPLAWKDYADLDKGLSVLSDHQLKALSLAIADNFEPFVIGETRVVDKNGKAAYGEFILVPRRAEELKAMSRQSAVAEIREAVRLGQKRGAKIIGLGAYTSVVTDGGLSLKDLGLPLPALTTGNSYTAVAARQTVRLAAAERGWELPRRTVAVVGANGAIGQALSTMLAADVGRLILIGNPEHPEESRRRLLQVAGRIVWSAAELHKHSALAQGSVASWVAELGFVLPAKPDHASLTGLGEELIRRTSSVLISTDAAAVLPLADIVVCCTSSTEPLIRADTLQKSAIVCDVSRPSNVHADVALRRPDVMILNGGVIGLPGYASLGFNVSLGPARAYACMAETMMLAMDQRYQDMSLGFDLPLSKVLEIGQRAEELGFQVVLDYVKGTGEHERHEEQSGSQVMNSAKKKWVISPGAEWRSLDKRTPKTNPEIREWYLEQVAKIPSQNLEWIAKGMSIQDRAKRAWKLRYDARMDARAMMSDPKDVKLLQARDATEYGDPDGPSFEFLVTKYQKEGLEHDAVYEAIIGNSNKTDAELNARLQVQKAGRFN
jgi:acetylornithine/succinyldiaminopimelate/putrescine aminotransferase/acyl-CoA synthetase (AMP-forming)/AMP-acid ligase II/predicted amino acid dehydrogenase/acyl carrier protein